MYNTTDRVNQCAGKRNKATEDQRLTRSIFEQPLFGGVNHLLVKEAAIRAIKEAAPVLFAKPIPDFTADNCSNWS